MDENFIKITPNKERAKAMLSMASVTYEMIKSIDASKFPSNISKEYYEIIRELIAIILNLDGWKTFGEGAHKKQIEYLDKNYKEFSREEIVLIEELRSIRNKIAYEGFFIDKEFLKSRNKLIEAIIKKLNGLIEKKLK